MFDSPVLIRPPRSPNGKAPNEHECLRRVKCHETLCLPPEQLAGGPSSSEGTGGGLRVIDAHIERREQKRERETEFQRINHRLFHCVFVRGRERVERGREGEREKRRRRDREEGEREGDRERKREWEGGTRTRDIERKCMRAEGKRGR